jgi:hypothetical protein
MSGPKWIYRKILNHRINIYLELEGNMFLKRVCLVADAGFAWIPLFGAESAATGISFDDGTSLLSLFRRGYFSGSLNAENLLGRLGTLLAAFELG